MDAINLKQFENNKYPWDDYNIKNRLTQVINSLQPNGMNKFIIATDDMACGYEVYTRYNVETESISISITANKNGKVIFSESQKSEFYQLDNLLLDLSNKLLKKLNLEQCY